MIEGVNGYSGGREKGPLLPCPALRVRKTSGLTDTPVPGWTVESRIPGIGCVPGISLHSSEWCETERFVCYRNGFERIGCAVHHGTDCIDVLYDDIRLLVNGLEHVEVTLSHDGD